MQTSPLPDTESTATDGMVSSGEKNQNPWKLTGHLPHLRRRRRRPCRWERGRGGYCPVSPQIPLHGVAAAADHQEGAHRPGASLWRAKGLSPNGPPHLRPRVSLPDIWLWEPMRLHPWNQKDAQKLETAQVERTPLELPATSPSTEAALEYPPDFMWRRFICWS